MSQTASSQAPATQAPSSSLPPSGASSSSSALAPAGTSGLSSRTAGLSSRSSIRRQHNRRTQPLEEAAQYLTCGVGEEVFALDVVQVREVLDLCPFSRVPNMPRYVRGMIDVRGQAVPVIDLRVKFGMSPAEPTDSTRIMVLEAVVEGRSLVIGALTDRVFEVTALDIADVEPPPEIGIQWRSEIIRGIGRRHGRFVIVLNLNRVFSMTDLTSTGVAV
ncbi:purine-binding chemotaxis protein CheW [Azospirillaceae bacterium]